MPSTERDVDVDAAPADDGCPREKQRRSKSERKPDRDRVKDKGRDRDRDRDRDREKHRSSRSTRSKVSEAGSEASSKSRAHRSSRKEKESTHRRDRDEERVKKSRSTSASDLFAGVSSTSLDRTRISLPYPSFSKAHSKEAVHSREDISGSRRGSNPLTPDTTDVGGAAAAGGDEDGAARRSKSAELPRESSVSKKSSRPPTPPDTDLSADKRRDVDLDEEEPKLRPKSRASGVSRSASLRNEGSSKVSDKSRSSSQATYVKAPKHKSAEMLRSDSRASSSSRRSAKRSSTLRDGRDADSLEADSSPSTPQDSSPQTPTQSAPFSPQVYGAPRPEPASTPDLDADLHSKTATPASGIAVPPPPPPPPPPAVDIQDLPRVDYLLQNGGLAYPAPKHFLTVLPRQNGTRPSNPPLAGADTLFAPFFNLLDQYQTVLNRQGSIAVATGHRSIARRLLDRLENVFSRDLPPHGCSCIMCERKGHEIHRGLTWGDVLEWVSGRIELPPWPPFDLAEISTRAAEISAEAPPRPASPVKMDPDIDEQFRDHYLRQSRKVRSSVGKWLNKTADASVPPPQDVDDETLNFAVMTSLEQDDRSYFNALLSGSREIRPATRAPTPAKHLRNDFIIKTGLSLQRLYRLQHAPRDAESAAYLIRNPQTHDLLVTLSNINNSEWEILTSGRFDGFLWSGADAEGSAIPGLDSRTTTPADRSGMSPGFRSASAMSSRSAAFSPYSRGTTPASHISLASSGLPGGGNARQPVSNDEEMEMAVISEIERDIYSGMECLEDAFEKLHHQAEMVRTALRQRGAGLMQNLQNRKRIDVLPSQGGQTPAHDRSSWGTGSEVDGGSDSEWGLDDVELMPDDSASNISSSRHRRPKRRTERRTPAPIEEDDEEY